MSAPSLSPAALPLRVCRPVGRRVRISELWTSLGIARMIGLRDMKAKYKQAALGPLWLIIGPLGMLLALTVAFSGVTSVQTSGVPYLLFALVGLTVWTFLQLSMSLGAMAIIGNGPLVRRSPLPRVALVTGSLIGNLPPVTIMLFATLVATLIDRGLPVQALLLPLLMAWVLLFTLAVSLILGALAARFRDTVSVIPLVIQAGIFVSPVGYSLEGAPKNIQTLLTLNPVSGLIEIWRWAILDLPDPHWDVIAIAGGWTVALAAVAWRTFGRLEVHFADFV